MKPLLCMNKTKMNNMNLNTFFVFYVTLQLFHQKMKKKSFIILTCF